MVELVLLLRVVMHNDDHPDDTLILPHQFKFSVYLCAEKIDRCSRL